MPGPELSGAILEDLRVSFTSSGSGLIVPGPDYFRAFVRVDRMETLLARVKDRPACVLYEQDAAQSDHEVLGQNEWRMYVVAYVLVEPDGTWEDAIREHFHDIEKAALVDRTRGSRALSTRVTGRTLHPTPGEATLGVGAMQFEIIYRTRPADPTDPT